MYLQKTFFILKVPLLPFNRAMLMNIGYTEANKDYDWSCYIFHGKMTYLTYSTHIFTN